VPQCGRRPGFARDRRRGRRVAGRSHRNQTATPLVLRKPVPVTASCATPLGLLCIGRRRQGRLASSPTLPSAVRTPLAFPAPGIERQRRSTTKPKIGARHERLPWVAVWRWRWRGAARRRKVLRGAGKSGAVVGVAGVAAPAPVLMAVVLPLPAPAPMRICLHAQPHHHAEKNLPAQHRAA
jgi:hypothetical protein